MFSLPPPSPNQAFCHVSALESGFIDLPLHLFLSNADPSLREKLTAPSLSFLIRHSKHSKTFLFDLGIRKYWQSYPPGVLQRINTVYHNGIRVPNDVCDSLAKGGLSPTDIDAICVSHMHWDHVSTAAPFTTSTFFLGAESKSLVESQLEDSNVPSVFANDLPPSRTQYFPSPEDPDSQFIQIGPFKALDFYKDGSLYIIDSPGHVRGHVNLLVRTSPDGGWIYLAADSAHHVDLITGNSEIACSDTVCAHENIEKAKEHIGKIRELMKIPRVLVLLAHDAPWYEQFKDSSAFWPGQIESK
ncbi:hypothetical protein VKT23_003677 [Stygiomarasmius scandens]|uniref:Metallo-beta-lactamase domain-containing protein n=1 Tax=Marasmiellus scandens TaxID=2682957 RepID=A0ABR1JXZ0_9AGAR